MKRKVQKQKQKQRQSQTVKVVVNLAEKKQKKKRISKRKTQREEEPELFRPLPPVVYIPPAQVTNYMIPQERPATVPRITEMKPIENPRSSLEIEDIRPLEFFPFGDEFPAEKEIKIVKKEPATSPKPASSSILQMEPSSASDRPILEKPAPPVARPIFPRREPRFVTAYATEYESSPEEYILPPKEKKKVAKKVKPEKVAEKAEAIPVREPEQEPEAKEQRARGRPAIGKYPNLGKASKQMLQSIYKIEFGVEPKANTSVEKLRTLIKKGSRLSGEDRATFIGNLDDLQILK